MYPNSNSLSTSRAEERRRNPRVRPSSLIFAQLGSGNGGIVVNLGMDGVACHAAQNLVAEKNSTLNVRLRGSGLNAEIVGELVWLGATQKEVGISFTSLSPDIRKEIADWMVREAQPVNPSEFQRKPVVKPLATTPESGAETNSEIKPVSRSSSAALAAARAMSADPTSSANGIASDSSLPIPVDSAAILSSPSLQSESLPLPEIISPLQDRPAPMDPVPSDLVEDNLHRVRPESFVPLGEASIEVPAQDVPRVEIPAIERPDLSPVARTYPPVHFEEAAPQPPVEALQTTTEPNDKIEIGKTVDKTVEGKSVARRTSFPLPRNSRQAILPEKWIPPALLDAWNRTNPQQKKMLAHVGAACMGGMLGLILIFGLTQMHSAAPKPAVNTTFQQSTTPPTPSIANDATPRANPVQVPAAQPAPAIQSTPGVQPAPSAPAATTAPQTDDPSASPLVNLANSIFGSKPATGPPINDHQMGVQVWAIQSSGYYYCADDPYTKSGQPGTLMAQGDALQAGYRARLGQFCN